MLNEFLFFLYISVISTLVCAAARISRETLVAFLCLLCVLMNFFVCKEIILFGFSATASDALGIGAALSLNLLQELYGKPYAQRTIWVSFFCSIATVIISLIHCALIPAPTDMTQAAFELILLPLPRIMAASLFSYFIVQQLDCLLYGYLIERYGTKWFVIRNYTSLLITQLLDTIIFSVLGLYGVMHNIEQIIVVSFIIKAVIIFTATPIVAFLKRFITPSAQT